MNGSSRWISPGVSRRRFLQLSSLTGMGIALAACVAPAPTDGMQEEPAMETIELRFQNWFNESDMHTWQIGLDQFKTERPDVDMKLEYAGWGDTTSTILAGAAAGDLPDVFMASDEHVPPVASVGLVLDLNPYIDAMPEINVDDFASGVSRGFNFWDAGGASRTTSPPGAFTTTRACSTRRASPIRRPRARPNGRWMNSWRRPPPSPSRMANSGERRLTVAST